MLCVANDDVYQSPIHLSDNFMERKVRQNIQKEKLSVIVIDPQVEKPSCSQQFPYSRLPVVSRFPS